MSMFKKQRYILAPQTGRTIDLEFVPDPVFSEKILGDGIAIMPTSNEVLAPISGRITQVAHTYHSISIEGDDSIEILIHLGIDTVNLAGEGFKFYAEMGQHVNAGDKILDLDLNFIKGRGYNAITPCIITKPHDIKHLKIKRGEVKAGVSRIITYKK